MTPRPSTLGLLLVGLSLSACDQPISARARTLATQQGTAANGQRLYSTSCASCHGADGKGTDQTVVGGIRISLPKTSAYHSAEEWLTYIVDGIPGTGMAAYGTWSDQDVLDVYAYVRTLPQ